MYDINFKIIKVGTSILDPGNMLSNQLAEIKSKAGIGGGSSVTVVFGRKHKLLVDTGFDNENDFTKENNDMNNQYLLNTLAYYNLQPKDIDKVFITHAHRDHYGNIKMFNEKSWYCLDSCIESFPEYLKNSFSTIREGEEIIDNVFIQKTPGHTRNHASVIIQNDNSTFKTIVSGDAIINWQWLVSGYVYKWNMDFFNEEEYYFSQNKLLNEADLIIPGHGQPFYTSYIKRL
jgi:glyoxylase-like metal-dependent hydrolase (beta-lactamase superfamily II)